VRFTLMSSLMRSRTAGVACLMAIMSLMYPARGSSQSKATLDSMTGVWCGSARIVVDWTVQKNLGLRLTIDASGNVTGQVGDAQLASGRVRTNRGPVGRMLHIRTDYIIVGRLRGPIIAAEAVARSEVKIPVNWTGSEFHGSVHTDGSSFGGKDHMVLSASRLVLRRWIVPPKREAGFC
jgi:hypothetical protein